MSSTLWPVWQYWLGSVGDDRLLELRSLREQFRQRSDETIDIAASLLATGKLAYLDICEPQSNHPVELGSVAYVQSGRLVVVCNILSELREKGVVGVDDAFSGAHDDMKDEYGTGEIIQGNTRFPCELEDILIHRTFVSLHDPTDSKSRSRVQKYFQNHLNSLLEPKFSANSALQSREFVLVTSVTTQWTTQLEHNHDTQLSDDCLECRLQRLRDGISYRDQDENAGSGQENSTAKSNVQFDIFFHVFPTPPSGDQCWGFWTISVNGDEYPLEPCQRFSYTCQPQQSIECAVAQAE
ncbi:hypothetical protein B0H13DRAFT_653262 [Mycena leptocephala]|nr:hypothetical protein B0H13DRAFT_653262 [Mycena leptocephala]